MEGIAIALLVMILVLGSVVFLVLLQFLALTRENEKRFQRILDRLEVLSRPAEKLSPPAPAPPVEGE